MKHIKNINVGEQITDFFVIRWIELRNYDGKPFLVMELGCSSGRIRGTYWDEDSATWTAKLGEGDIIKVRATATEYKNQKCLKIEKMRKAKSDEIDYQKLLPRGKYSPTVLRKRLKKDIESVSDKQLSRLLELLFFEDAEFMDKFSIYPAAKLWHGAYIGGLLEHTLRVAKICEIASSFYPACRKELLLCGALVHDIGKVEEISIKGYFDYNVPGRLLGHTSLGAIMVDKAIDKIPNFPENIKYELLHLILSHHGEYKYGAPVEPKTLEAVILHFADMLDAQAEGIQHIIERDLPRGQDFSEYIKLLGRFIYLDGYRNENMDIE